MSENRMTLEEAIQYLQPIADSSSLKRYAEALATAISAMKELEFTRHFIHDQGLVFALLNEWDNRKDHIADDGKKVRGRLERVYEDSFGWVDRCSRCKTIVNDTERECPGCRAKFDKKVGVKYE